VPIVQILDPQVSAGEPKRSEKARRVRVVKAAGDLHQGRPRIRIRRRVGLYDFAGVQGDPVDGEDDVLMRRNHPDIFATAVTARKVVPEPSLFMRRWTRKSVSGDGGLGLVERPLAPRNLLQLRSVLNYAERAIEVGTSEVIRTLLGGIHGRPFWERDPLQN
jgi:hypothetical protein